MSVFDWREGPAPTIKVGKCPPRLRPEKIKAMLDMVDSGMSYQQIVRELGVSANSITRHRRKRAAASEQCAHQIIKGEVK